MVRHASGPVAGARPLISGAKLRLLLRAGNKAAVRELKAELSKQVGNLSRTARALDIEYRTLVRYMHLLDLFPFLHAIRSKRPVHYRHRGAQPPVNSDTNVIVSGGDYPDDSGEDDIGSDAWPF